MFSSRNLHFGVLGLILGATAAYLFASYQIAARSPAARSVVSADRGPELPKGHPEVSNAELLKVFETVIEKTPNDPVLMARYANLLFDLDRFDEAVDWYEKALALEPNNVNLRSDMATALWNLDRHEEAITEYEKSLEIVPEHMLTLHKVFLVKMRGQQDLASAEAILGQMERIDPTYAALPALQEEMEEAARSKRSP